MDNRENLKLYPWQEECIRKWEKEGYCGIADVVTGAGKTVLALGAAVRLRNALAETSGNLETPPHLRVKIIVPSVPLALQWAREARTILPALGFSEPKCGLFYGAQKGNPECDVMIYVLNSARYAVSSHILNDIRQGFHVLLIADECHRFASPENRKLFDFKKGTPELSWREAAEYFHSLGLSATLREEDYETFLKGALGPVFFHYNFAAAVRDGLVSSFVIFQVALSFTAEELAVYMELSDKMSTIYRQLADCFPYLKGLSSGQLFAVIRKLAAEEGEDSPAALYLNLAYKRKSVSCTAISRCFCAADLAELLEPDAKILIFGERIDQAERVYQSLSMRYPGRVGRYHSGMTAQAKKNTLSAYRDGSLRILVSCRGLDEGIDVPEANVGIVLSGSSVSRQRIQRLGRLLRKKDGKTACLYYFYIRESAEDAAYLSLPDNSFSVCDMFYSAPDHAFGHPVYEELAARLLEDAEISGLSIEKLRELRNCLLEGLVRPDWLKASEEYSACIESAENRHEKNYWLSMKRLARLR